MQEVIGSVYSLIASHWGKILLICGGVYGLVRFIKVCLDLQESWRRRKEAKEEKRLERLVEQMDEIDERIKKQSHSPYIHVKAEVYAKELRVDEKLVGKALKRRGPGKYSNPRFRKDSFD